MFTLTFYDYFNLSSYVSKLNHIGCAQVLFGRKYNKFQFETIMFYYYYNEFAARFAYIYIQSVFPYQQQDFWGLLWSHRHNSVGILGIF